LYHGWDLADAIKDLNFVRSDGKTLIPQPHLRFDNKDMWTLDDVRGHTLMSPLTLLREMTPEAREKHLAEYRQGFKIQSRN
jgi:propane monooxygenase large subunit